MLRRDVHVALAFSLVLVGYYLFSAVASIPGLGWFTIVLRAIILAYPIFLLLTSRLVIANRSSLTLLVFVSLLFFCYQLRVIWDVYVLSINSQSYYVYTLEFWFMTLLPVLVYVILSAESICEKSLINACFYMLLVSSLLNTYFGFKELRIDGAYGLRLGTEKANPIVMGYMYVFLWLSCFARWSLGGGGGWMALALYVALFWFIFLTGSRGPMVVYLLIGGVALYLRCSIFKAAGWVLVFGPGVFFTLQSLGAFEASAYLKRIQGVGRDTSSSSRLESFSGAFHQFSQSPMLGDSLEEAGSGYYPHNLILEILMSMGVVGGLMFFVILIVLSREVCIAIFREGANPGNVFLSLYVVAILIGMMFSSSFVFSSALFISLAALINLNSKRSVV